MRQWAGRIPRGNCLAKTWLSRAFRDVSIREVRRPFLLGQCVCSCMDKSQRRTWTGQQHPCGGLVSLEHNTAKSVSLPGNRTPNKLNRATPLCITTCSITPLKTDLTLYIQGEITGALVWRQWNQLHLNSLNLTWPHSKPESHLSPPRGYWRTNCPGDHRTHPFWSLDARTRSWFQNPQ